MNDKSKRCTIVASTTQIEKPLDSIQQEVVDLEEDHNLVTFADANGVLVSEPTPVARNDDQNPYLAPDLSAILTRPIHVGTTVWQPTLASGSMFNTLDIAALWMNDSYMRDVLSRFRYFACDFKVTIRLQSPFMMAGLLAFAWLPCALESKPRNLKSMFALDIYTLDASNPEVLEINIPYLSPLKWWSVQQMRDPLDKMSLTPILMSGVLAPLVNAQSALASVNYTIYIEAQNIRLAGQVANTMLTPKSRDFFQSELSGKENSRVKNRGVVRYVTDSVPHYVSVRQMASVGQSLEDDTTVRLSLAKDTLMDTSPAMVNALTPDEHALLNIMKRPSLVSVTSLNVGAPLNIYFPALPGYSPDFNGRRGFTNAQLVSRWARYYQGTMKYAVTFVAPAVATVRVMVRIIYENSPVATASNNYATAIWDITGTMTKTFSVPQLSHSPYLPCGEIDPNQIGGGPDGVPCISITTLNPLVVAASTTVAPPMTIIITSAVDDDFRLFVPVGPSLGDTTFYTPDFFQSYGAIFSEKFDSLGTLGEEIKLPEYNFGEELVDIKDLLGRYYLRPGNFSAKIVRNLPNWFRGLYRFNRYGNRFKVLDPTNVLKATYESTDGILYQVPPTDIVPLPTAAVGQWELPYYESWYYDLPDTSPTSAILISVPASMTNTQTWISVSADSLFSFPTMSVSAAVPPP